MLHKPFFTTQLIPALGAACNQDREHPKHSTSLGQHLLQVVLPLHRATRSKNASFSIPSMNIYLHVEQ